MALLNRFFSSRKRPFARPQDNVSEKLFTFTNEQVRVVVFRECDFRGRKLLFDSRTVQKVALVDVLEAGPDQDPPVQKKFAEVSGGHAYTYTKPSSDVSRLGEMIFGSVAMSFRGTTYKIHSVPVPSQLVCSQVFPSPKNPIRLRRSAPSNVHAGSNIEHSIRLEDSGASSATSGSDQSVLSGASDTVLVCKRQQSVPQDVPVNFSLVSSSGYGEDHSYSSVSSGPQSIPVDLSQGVPSGDSLNRRLPWSTTTSMDPSTGSLPGSVSTDDGVHKVRSSKIGLAVLIELTDGEEMQLEQFLMEHAALIEMLMWRIRRSVEGAYIRHSTFVSVMHDISMQTARWLVDLLNGARALVQTWHSHFPNCDNLFSIIKNSPSISFLGHLTDRSSKSALHCTNRDSVRFSTLASGGGLFSSFKSDSGCVFESGGEFSFVNLGRFLKGDHGMGSKGEEGTLLAEKFVKEFCELLESVDVKHTNFFISTLVTAVLTHHLGWVNTVLPVALKPNKTQPDNPFWSQLTELYGAIGYPLKMSRTVVSGSNKSDLVPKILNALKYFIRCTDVSRHCKVRVNIDWENERADAICSANSCIPKENYKRYEDHLKEIEEFTKAENELKMLNAETFIKPAKKLVLTKTHKCLTELCKLSDNEEVVEKHSEILDKVTNMGLQAINPGDKINLSCSFLQKINSDEQQLVDINEAKQQVERVFSPKKKIPETGMEPLENIVDKNVIKKQGSERPLLKSSKSFMKIIPTVDEAETISSENNNVVFVLGDNEELVGIKKETNHTKRPTDLPLKNLYTQDAKIKTKEKPKYLYSSDDKSATEESDCQFKGSELKIPQKFMLSDSADYNQNETVVKFNKSHNAGTNIYHRENDFYKQSDFNIQNLPNRKFENMDIFASPGLNKSIDLDLYAGHVNDDSVTTDFVKPEKFLNKSSPEVFTEIHNTPKFTKQKSLSTLNVELLPLNKFNTGEFENVSNDRPQGEVLQFDSSFQKCIKPLDHENCSAAVPDNENSSFKNSPEEFYTGTLYENLDTSPFKDTDFTQCLSGTCIKPSTSFTKKQSCSSKTQRAMSEPPDGAKPFPCTSTKYKYTGVKFNFQQYPQIVENYMKNKNIELSNMQFLEKKLDFRWQSSETTFDFSKCEDDGANFEESEPLTTPSNASELEFTSELVVDKAECRKAEEVVETQGRRLEFTRNVVPNTVIKEPNPYEHAKLLKDTRNRTISEEGVFSNLKIVELPMPKSQEVELPFRSIDYTNSLIRDMDDHYVSDMVLQGTSAPKYEWEPILKKDLVLSTQHSFSNQQVEESIAIVANTDTWEVQLMSSHTYVINRSAAGVPVGMSQLVANMLETLLHMWRLHTPAEYCLMHIEQQLQEFCLRSKALAQLLLDTDFCSMEILTSTLRLEVNDVPLLMAIASTHTPQVTQKYGLSFQ